MEPPPLPSPSAAPPPVGAGGKAMLEGLNLGGLMDIGMSDPPDVSGSPRWEPPTVQQVAPLFLAYEVLHLLGRGGMGAVYAAKHLSLDRRVAIKLLPLESSRDEAFVQRFHREARALAKLQHPGIVAVHDFGTTRDGHLFFVMEFVEGATLSELIHGGHLEVAAALDIVKQMCEALAYAHGEGVIHRDIKPSNVLVDKKGRVKVADFGLAKMSPDSHSPPAPSTMHTKTGAGLGTPDYAAPEQMSGSSAVDHRADIYSLGVMFYEMLTGQVPRGWFEPPSQKSGTDVKLDSVVQRAMHEKPERRYQAATEMRDDVTRVQQSSSVQPPRGERPRRSFVSTAFIGVLSVCVVVVGVWWLWMTFGPITNKPMLKVAVSQPVSSPKPIIAGKPSPKTETAPITPPPAPAPKPAPPVVKVDTPKPTPAKVQPAPPMPVAAQASTPAETATFKGRRYTLITKPMKWAEAHEFAVKQGARIASADSAEVSRWLTETFASHQPKGVFLGGQCWTPGGAWEWDDGHEWNWSGWTEATPFYGTLILRENGKWEAGSFDEARPFVIQFP